MDKIIKPKLLLGYKAKSSIALNKGLILSKNTENNKNSFLYTNKLSTKSFSIYKRKYKDHSNNSNTSNLIDLKYNLDLTYQDDYLSDEISYKGKI